MKAVLFHCQQAAEKALKGFLTWHDKPFRKTHLWAYAWKFRYPGASLEPTLQEASEALNLAQKVVDCVLVRLPSDVRL